MLYWMYGLFLRTSLFVCDKSHICRAYGSQSNQIPNMFICLFISFRWSLPSNYSVKRSIKLKCWMLTLIKECSIFHYKCKQTVGSPATMWELLLLLLLVRQRWRREVATAAPTTTTTTVAGDGFCAMERIQWKRPYTLLVCSLVHSRLKSKHAPVHIFIKSNHIN